MITFSDVTGNLFQFEINDFIPEKCNEMMKPVNNPVMEPIFFIRFLK